jgi:hypothetical protein
MHLHTECRLSVAHLSARVSCVVTEPARRPGNRGARRGRSARAPQHAAASAQPHETRAHLIVYTVRKYAYQPFFLLFITQGKHRATPRAACVLRAVFETLMWTLNTVMVWVKVRVGKPSDVAVPGLITYKLRGSWVNKRNSNLS